MSGHRPWSEIRRRPKEQQMEPKSQAGDVHILGEGKPYEELRDRVIPPERQAANDREAERMVDSIPSYEDLPEFISWLDRKGGIKREDFAD